jgi:glyoxylase-like metal-dependent hydrolase (beta-lactamase superfamily II)
MIFKQLFDSNTSTYTYLLGDEKSKEAVIIDPVAEHVERDLKLIEELGLELTYVLDTHVHADHVTGSGKLRERTGAKTVLGKDALVACADLGLADGDKIPFGAYEVEVRSTPGHTDGCTSFVVDNEGQYMAFTGDALLIRGCGRTDFQQGSASRLFNSVHTQIFTLPDNTLIYPGHDYKGHMSSTVGEEKAHNPRLNADITEADFVGIMDALKLAKPRLIDVAVPANQACGFAPVEGVQ